MPSRALVPAAGLMTRRRADPDEAGETLAQALILDRIDGVPDCIGVLAEGAKGYG